MCENPETDLEDTYLMGHRLFAFHAHALPKHPEYKNRAVTRLRAKSMKDLEWIRERLSEIALRIDEEQLNKFILHDFEPEPDDDLSTSSEEADAGQQWGSQGEVQWANFDTDKNTSSPASFIFDPFDLSGDTEDTSTTSNEASSSQDVWSDPEPSVGADPEVLFPAPFSYPVPEHEVSADDSQEEKEEQPPEENPEPRVYVELHGEEDEEDYRYMLSEERMATAFLKSIANEDVQYETDSEAHDSWAQDGDSLALSGASSGTALTCDPARIALREIMNRYPRSNSLYSNQEADIPPPPPPAPSNSPADVPSDESKKVTDENSGSRVAQRDHWASFDFASARRRVQVEQR